jgi:hypothetical protein
MYCRKWAAMLCGEMQKYVEKTPDSVLSIPKRRQLFAQGKLPTLLADPQSSWSLISAFSALAVQA